MQFDIAVGDAVEPLPAVAEMPVLLDMPVPRLRVHPRESVVAEKFEAMVNPGIVNTRVKDFYDVWVLSREFSFDGSKLASALAGTFARRGTTLPDGLPLAFTPEFCDDPDRVRQWKAFLNKGVRFSDVTLSTVVSELKRFLLPPGAAARRGDPFNAEWSAAKGWRL